MPRASRPIAVLSALLLTLPACAGSPAADRTTGDSASPATTTAAPAAASAPSTDPELERLKSVTPVVACDLLPVAKIAPVFPGTTFTKFSENAPQLSGYAWDSRCEYRAGVGSVSYSKDTPTHSVQVFVRTLVDDAKAQANLASRVESAATATNYTPQPALGPSAYTISNVGYVSAFFVKGNAEVQLNVSELERLPVAQKVARVVALAKTM